MLARYKVSPDGWSIFSTATGKVVGEAQPNFPIPDHLRIKEDRDRKYQEPEELIRRMIRKAVENGDMTGGGFRLTGDRRAIIDGKGETVIASTPVFLGEEFRPADGGRAFRNIDAKRKLIDLLTVDAASTWRGDNFRCERRLNDCVLRVEKSDLGWIVLRDAAILTGPNNTPATFATRDAALAAAEAANSAHTALWALNPQIPKRS